jgi:hypothetical protein
VRYVHVAIWQQLGHGPQPRPTNVGLPNGTIRLLWRLDTGATAEHSELTAALPRVVIGM